MIFDVKIDNLIQKARLVSGGHTEKAPNMVTYAIVISSETFHIYLTIAALNDPHVKCGDVLNAYITSTVMELIWTTLSPKFGNDQGKMAIFFHTLYGLKSSVTAFRKHLGECMSGLSYKPCLADPNIWLKPEVRDNGVE